MAANVEIVFTAQDNTGGILGNIGSGLSNLGNIVTGIQSAFNLLSGAFDTAANIVTPFINSASESEQAIAKLEATLIATSGAVGLSSEQLQDLANSLQDVTRFSDEEIMSAEALMLTFRNVSGDVFPRAIEAAVDMAEMFGSLESSTMQLGKALQDPVGMMGALSRAGVTFSDAQKEMIKNFVETGDVAAAQNIILSEVEAQVGNLAEAMGQTFAGKVSIFQNKLDEIKETIGGAFLPVLTLLMDKFMEFIENNAPLQKILDFLGLLNEYTSKGVPLLESLGLTFLNIGKNSDWISNLNPILKDMAIAFFTAQSTLDEGGTWLDAISNGLASLKLAWQGTPLENIVTTLQTFLDTAEKEGWGEAFKGLFADIWSGFDVKGKIQELVNNLSGAIETTDWSSVTTTLGDILEKAATTAITGVLVGLDIIVNQIDWSPLGRALRGALSEAWQGAIEDGVDGKSLWDNIVDGVLLGAIMNPMWAPFITAAITTINKVKEIFGISSPSTVFMQIGRDIIGGLLAGITSMSSTIINGFKNLLDDILSLPGFQQIADALGIGGGSIGGATGDATGLLGGGGTAGSGSGPGTGAGGVLSAGTVTNNYNFYGTVYVSGMGPEGTYDCAPSITGAPMIPAGIS